MMYPLFLFQVFYYRKSLSFFNNDQDIGCYYNKRGVKGIPLTPLFVFNYTSRVTLVVKLEGAELIESPHELIGKNSASSYSIT
jgi:hypothetical protein